MQESFYWLYYGILICASCVTVYSIYRMREAKKELELFVAQMDVTHQEIDTLLQHNRALLSYLRDEVQRVDEASGGNVVELDFKKER